MSSLPVTTSSNTTFSDDSFSPTSPSVPSKKTPDRRRSKSLTAMMHENVKDEQLRRLQEQGVLIEKVKEIDRLFHEKEKDGTFKVNLYHKDGKPKSNPYFLRIENKSLKWKKKGLLVTKDQKEAHALVLDVFTQAFNAGIRKIKISNDQEDAFLNLSRVLNPIFQREIKEKIEEKLIQLAIDSSHEQSFLEAKRMLSFFETLKSDFLAITKIFEQKQEKKLCCLGRGSKHNPDGTSSFFDLFPIEMLQERSQEELGEIFNTFSNEDVDNFWSWLGLSDQVAFISKNESENQEASLFASMIKAPQVVVLSSATSMIDCTNQTLDFYIKSFQQYILSVESLKKDVANIFNERDFEESSTSKSSNLEYEKTKKNFIKHRNDIECFISSVLLPYVRSLSRCKEFAGSFTNAFARKVLSFLKNSHGEEKIIQEIEHDLDVQLRTPMKNFSPIKWEELTITIKRLRDLFDANILAEKTHPLE